MREKFYSTVKAGSRLLLLTLTLISLTAYAQAQITIRGTVTDAQTGAPISGVAIMAVGTSAATTTQMDGKYVLKAPEGVTAIKFTITGYEDRNVQYNGQTEINATLTEAVQVVDEIVVVGYGTMRKKDLTGSVSTVSAEILESMPVSNVSEAIAGRMAGVSVTTSEGGPDAEIKIRVRGGGSITQDNSPLYIVDGFPVESMNSIASSDIESMTVLKDASSTAIYGARGANGVIIITTKSGKTGKPTVTFNAYAGFKNLTKKLKVLDPYEYVMWQYELANYTSSTVDNDSYFQKYYGAFDDLELYKFQKGINWQDEVFGRTAITQNYNIGVTGGSDKVKYNINLAHTNDESIMIGSGFERSNISIKVTTDISKKLRFEIQSRWSKTIINGAGTSTDGQSSVPRLKHALKYAPTKGLAAFVDDDDDFLADLENSSEFYNPVDITRDEYRKEVRINQNYNAALNWKITKELTYRVELGFSTAQKKIDRFWGLATSTARNNNGQPVAEISDRDTYNKRIANTLTYNPKLSADHALTIMAGQEASIDDYKQIVNQSKYFDKSTTKEQALGFMNLGTAEPTKIDEVKNDNMLSFFGRVNYSYKDKYLLTATFRADGSSRFAKGNQWGYFPSVALGWRISDEPWMKSTSSWLNSLKMRLSYGAAGNNRIQPNLWKQKYVTQTSSKPIAIDNEGQTVLVPSSILYNESLKWETTITRNLGFDFGLFRGRINGTVDLYWNTTKDLLINASIPSSSGYASQYQNIGETSNKGIELTLDATVYQDRDWNIGASFNISHNKNKVEKLGYAKSMEQGTYWYNASNPADAEYLIKEGRSLGEMYGYRTLGMYQIDDFDYTYNQTTGRATWTLKDGIAASSGVTGGTDLPGSLRLKGSGSTVTTDDREIIGNAMPKFTGGFNVTVRYKAFDLGAYFNYSYGNDIYNANKIEMTTTPLTRKYGNLMSFMSDRFTYIDRNTGKTLIHDIDALRAANKNAKIWSPIQSRVPLHSWAVEDGSFLRLSNVTIGYTLPKAITQKFFVSNLRVYITAYNLALWTKYTGFDPEVDAKRSTPLTPGVDYSAFPRARTFVAGVNITF